MATVTKKHLHNGKLFASIKLYSVSLFVKCVDYAVVYIFNLSLVCVYIQSSSSLCVYILIRTRI